MLDILTHLAINAKNYAGIINAGLDMSNMKKKYLCIYELQVEHKRMSIFNLQSFNKNLMFFTTHKAIMQHVILYTSLDTQIVNIAIPLLNVAITFKQGWNL